jgi:hypothetical protein
MVAPLKISQGEIRGSFPFGKLRVKMTGQKNQEDSVKTINGDYRANKSRDFVGRGSVGLRMLYSDFSYRNRVARVPDWTTPCHQ